MRRALDLTLDALAAYRLTRLITLDELLHEPREAIVEAAYNAANKRTAERCREAELTSWAAVAIEDVDDHEAPKLAVLVTCRWCTGMWVALGVVAVRRFRWWRPLRDALALGSAAALVAGLERD